MNLSERRAPVQAARIEKDAWPPYGGYGPHGTIAWEEHVKAHADYDRKYDMFPQSAERIAERGGFSHGELIEHLGHPPTTCGIR